MSGTFQRNTVLLSGYAKLPASTTAEAVYNILVVAVVFDIRTGVIIDAEASMVTDLAKRFISELMVGYNMHDGPDELMAYDYLLGLAESGVEITAVNMIPRKLISVRRENMA